MSIGTSPAVAGTAQSAGADWQKIIKALMIYSVNIERRERGR